MLLMAAYWIYMKSLKPKMEICNDFNKSFKNSFVLNYYTIDVKIEKV